MYCFAKMCRFCKTSDKRCYDITSKMFQEISHIYNILSRDSDAELNLYLQQVCQKCFQMLTSISDILSECNRTDIVFKKYLSILKTNGKSYAKYECILKDDTKKQYSRTNCLPHIYEIFEKTDTEGENNEKVLINFYDMKDSETTQTQNISFNISSEINGCSGNMMVPEIIETKVENEYNEQEIIDLNMIKKECASDTCAPCIYEIPEKTATEGENNEEVIINFYDMKNLETTQTHNINFNISSKINECNESAMMSEVIKTENVESNNLQERKENLEERDNLDEIKFVPVGNTENLYLGFECYNTLLDKANYNYQSIQGCKDDSKQQFTNIVNKNNVVFGSKLKDGKKIFFECDICDRRYKTKQILSRHKRIHSDELPFECDICYRRFTHNSTLIGHKKTHNSERPFQCDICNRKFKTKPVFFKHKLIHSAERIFECYICNKRFKNKEILIGHRLIHNDERPFKCDVCSKTFLTNVNLVRHTKIHTGKRRFACDICNKRFKTKDVLIGHMRIHSGERPFECDICNKTFIQKSGLIVHKTNHSSERPFECDICNRRFKRKYALLRHKIDVCSKKFIK